MGTRGLIAVMLDGQYKVAQYCQWDMYPGGQGTQVLEFLHDKNNRLALLAGARHTVMWTIPEAKASGENLAQWSRDVGADILKTVATSERGLILLNHIDFAADSVFCEYAYVIDFDKQALEVFKGFNERPLKPTARFGQMERPRHANGEVYSHYPVRLLRRFYLNHLPPTKVFVKKLNKAAHPDEEAAE